MAITGVQCPQLLHSAAFHQYFWPLPHPASARRYPAFFYWACPVDSGSRRGANRLEKHSLSRPRHISLHHSRSSERRKSFPPRRFPLTLLPSCSLLFQFSAPHPHPARPPLTREGSVTKLSVTLVGISALLCLPLTLPVDWNCCHSKSIRNGS